MNGIIRKLTDKGFGFIATNELKKDLFFHSNALVGISFDELREGDGINFDIEENLKGINAINVQRNGGFIDDNNENSDNHQNIHEIIFFVGQNSTIYES